MDSPSSGTGTPRLSSLRLARCLRPVAVIGSARRRCAACLLPLAVVVVPPAAVPPVTVVVPPVAGVPPVALLPLAEDKDVRRVVRMPPVALLPLVEDEDVRGAARVCLPASKDVRDGRRRGGSNGC
jgi:hypothetical protein